MSKEPQTVPPSTEGKMDTRQMSGMATASVVLGVLSLVCGLFASLPAIICGRKALAEIRRSEGQLGGESRAKCGLFLGYAVSVVCCLGLVVAVLLPGFARENSAARRSSCANNLKQIGLDIRMFATEHAGSWPALDSRPGHLMFVKEEIYVEPAILVCPADRKSVADVKGLEPLPRNIASFLEASGYWYLGYALPTEEDGLAFAETYQTLMKSGTGLPKGTDIVTAQGKSLPALKDGVEGRYIQNTNDPAAIARAQATIPVIVERPQAHDGGANVLYMDGHVEFVRYPGTYPMTARFINAIESIQVLRGK